MAGSIGLRRIERWTEGRHVRGGDFEVFGDVDPRGVGHAPQVRDSAPPAEAAGGARSTALVPAV